MASGEMVVALSEELTCPICLEIFTDPVSLECEHHFCGSWITQVWEKVLGDVSCPQCQRVFTQRNSRPSRTMSNIAEQVRRLSFRARQREEEFYCRDHDEKLKLFCKDELEMICVDCWSSEHQAHSVISIKAATEIYKEKLKAALASLKRKMEDITARIITEEAKMGEPKVWVEELTDKIRVEFEKMHNFLNEQEEALRRQLSEEERKVLRRLEEKVKEIKGEMSTIEGRISEVQTQLKLSDNRMLKGIEGLLSRCDVQNQEVEVEDEFSRQLLVKPFQYFRVWRAMRRIIEPVPEYLTLDPETANRQLILCQDLVSVKQRDEEQGEEEEPVDPPARFDEYLCVLSSQGFTCGRHYWEVVVGNKVQWVIGVCRQSVNRKGDILTIPSHGYWVIGLFKDNDYRASTCQDTVILVDRKIWRLGVYLDYEEGEVSFYDADEMSHLYTFTDTFTEKLYPIFNPCNNLTGRNDEPLTLFSG